METPLDQPYYPPSEPPKRMPLGKIVLLNFGIMLAYLAITGVGAGEAQMGSLAADAFLILGQTGINFVLGIIFLFTDLRHIGQAMVISALIVGSVGFGLCIGKYSVFG